jgi:hypothetical protein
LILPDSSPLFDSLPNAEIAHTEISQKGDEWGASLRANRRSSQGCDLRVEFPKSTIKMKIGAKIKGDLAEI